MSGFRTGDNDLRWESLLRDDDDDGGGWQTDRGGATS